jgi:hypothetical protein
MAGAIASTGKTDYTTPEYMLRPVRAFFRAVLGLPPGIHDPNPIDLDPCSNPRAEVFAHLNIQKEALSQEQKLLAKHRESVGIRFEEGDGLEIDYAGKRVFINPPFGYGIGRWIRKALFHSQTQPGAFLSPEIKPALSILLVPETPDTEIWKDSVLMQAMGRCQIGHRPKFKGFDLITGEAVKNGIPKPCAYLYFGPEEFYPLFKQIFEVMGRVECPYRVYRGQGRIWTQTKGSPFPPVENGELFVSPFLPPDPELTQAAAVSGDVQNAEVVS